MPDKTDPAEVGEGLHYGLSFDLYLAIDAVNSGLLKKMTVPAKAKRYLDGFDDIDADKNDAIQIGLLTHFGLLEPGRFNSSAIVFGGESRRGNAWKTFVAETPDLLHVLPKNRDTASAIIDSIHAEHGKDFFLSCRSEVTVLWFDNARGVWFKARLDAHWEALQVILDVKTAADASPEGFRKAITNQQYHIQTQLYLEGVEQVTGKKHDWLWLAVEKKEDYLSAIRGIEPLALEIARETIDERVLLLQDCMEKGDWPGYPKGENSGLTDWAYRQYEKGEF